MRLERTRRRPQAIHRAEGASPADRQGTAMSAEGVALPSFAWDFCSVVGFLAQSSEIMDGARRPDLQRADPHRVDVGIATHSNDSRLLPFSAIYARILAAANNEGLPNQTFFS